MTVLVLEDAAEDMESGRRFYESRESGIGDYFIEFDLFRSRLAGSLRGGSRCSFWGSSDAVTTLPIWNLLSI
jgi:hypothetical protein